MSDMEEETFDLASEQCTSTINPHEMSNADLFSLFKTYMDTRLSGIETSFTDTTHTLEKKVKKAENSFKFKGHQVQYELNVDLQDDSEDEKNIRAADTRAVKKLKSVKSADKKKNVRKRPAASSSSSSQTAHNAIPVSVSMPPFHRSSTGYGNQVKRSREGNMCFRCGLFGHWASDCQKRHTKTGFGAPRGTS
ncbi:unnamed protein product [Mytilus edulis]|uniref:CCHC-type domain-containing protein n=1 Tax=Mytilus edulis TaxID=6550 RepID=A0A8S3TRA7_MYTED|nr:unnamed protein product [Mytilus edulis]